MARRTTSAIGEPPVFRRAFTLVEILIVIALLGLVTAVLVTDVPGLLDATATRTAFDSVRDAVNAGRRDAVNAGTPVRIVWLKDGRLLRVISENGVADFPAPDADEIVFSSPDFDDPHRAKPLDSLVFHPSGAAIPARIELSVKGVTRSHRLDMFSGVLIPEETR